MKKSLPVLMALIVALVSNAFSQKNAASPDLLRLVETEREFSRTSAAKGTRDAFLAFLADDGIVFSPGPANGKKTWEARPKRPGLLSWEPIYADISTAGDMGYTTGPWEFRPKGAEDKPAAFGNYMTIWKKQADGTFKFALDLGISNPQPASKPALSFSAVKPRSSKNAPEEDVVDGRAGLLNMEREFSKMVADKGVLKAYPAYLADEARLFREGKFPFVGIEAARTALAEGSLSWQPVSSDISRSIDMGYTYGTYAWKSADGKQEESGNYVHIWKRHADGKWKVVIEVLNPVPKQTT